MEPEGSLPYSQAPATRPYPESTPSSPHDPLQRPEHPSRVYTLTVIKVVPCNQMTGPCTAYKTTLVVLTLCICYIRATTYEQQRVEAAESIPELVYCSAHLHEREVSQDGGTAWCL
jgi:hypothetical protein